MRTLAVTLAALVPVLGALAAEFHDSSQAGALFESFVTHPRGGIVRVFPNRSDGMTIVCLGPACADAEIAKGGLELPGTTGGLFVAAGHRGNEAIGVKGLIAAARWLSDSNASSGLSGLLAQPLWLAPVVSHIAYDKNVNLSRHGITDLPWRKKPSELNRWNCSEAWNAGVNLGANYDIHRAGDDVDHCSASFGGEEPESEDEVKVIAKIIRERKPVVVLDLGAFGGIVRTPVSWQGKDSAPTAPSPEEPSDEDIAAACRALGAGIASMSNSLFPLEHAQWIWGPGGARAVAERLPGLNPRGSFVDWASEAQGIAAAEVWMGPGPAGQGSSDACDGSASLHGCLWPEEEADAASFASAAIGAVAQGLAASGAVPVLHLRSASATNESVCWALNTNLSLTNAGLGRFPTAGERAAILALPALGPGVEGVWGSTSMWATGSSQAETAGPKAESVAAAIDRSAASVIQAAASPLPEFPLPASPSATASASTTPSATPSMTPSASVSASVAPSASPSAGACPSPTPNASASPSANASATPSVSPSPAAWPINVTSASIYLFDDVPLPLLFSLIDGSVPVAAAPFPGSISSYSSFEPVIQVALSLCSRFPSPFDPDRDVASDPSSSIPPAETAVVLGRVGLVSDSGCVVVEIAIASETQGSVFLLPTLRLHRNDPACGALYAAAMTHPSLLKPSPSVSPSPSPSESPSPTPSASPAPSNSSSPLPSLSSSPSDSADAPVSTPSPSPEDSAPLPGVSASPSPSAGGGTTDGSSLLNYILITLLLVAGGMFLYNRYMQGQGRGNFAPLGGDNDATGRGRRVGGSAGQDGRGSSEQGRSASRQGAVDDDAMETARIMVASAAEAGQSLTLDEALASLGGGGDGPARGGEPAATTGARYGVGASQSSRTLRLGGGDDASTSPAETSNVKQVARAEASKQEEEQRRSEQAAAAAAAAATDPFAAGDEEFESWDIEFDDDVEDTGLGQSTAAPAPAGTEAARERELEYTSNAVAVGGALPEDSGAGGGGLGRLGQVRFARPANQAEDGFDSDW